MERYGEGKKRRARRKRGAKGSCSGVIELDGSYLGYT